MWLHKLQVSAINTFPGVFEAYGWMKDQLDFEEIKRKIVPVLKRNNVVRAGLFGSLARREGMPDSDVDLLIDFGDNRKTLFDLVDLEDELERVLGRKVDLVFYDGLKPRLR